MNRLLDSTIESWPFRQRVRLSLTQGSHFDPQVVKVFESILPTLDNAEPALVVELHG